ncbi:MAG: hypothetical protein ACLQME_19225 [Alphaproteobacteria bacterium]
MTDVYDQDVLDCLDRWLSSHGYHARVDSAQITAAGELVAAFEQRARNGVALHNQRVPPQRRRPVYVFFCENLTYGAFALRDHYDFVVLYLGMVPTIVDFSRRMMATDGLWDDIGDSKPIRVRGRGRTDMPSVPAHRAWTKLPPRAPDNPVRDAFAIVFASECFDFIVRHELAHLVLGHCDFLAPSGNTAMIKDTDGRLANETDVFAVQTLEIAADGHAAIWGVEQLPHVQKTFGSFPEGVDEALRRFHRTPDEALRNYLLAMFFVFRFFDEIAWSTENLTCRQHPPAPFRFHAACVHLHEHFERTGDTGARECLRRVLRVIWELGEFIFAKTLDREPNPCIKSQVLDDESKRHFALLHERSQTLPQRLFGLTD